MAKRTSILDIAFEGYKKGVDDSFSRTVILHEAYKELGRIQREARESKDHVSDEGFHDDDNDLEGDYFEDYIDVL